MTRKHYEAIAKLINHHTALPMGLCNGVHQTACKVLANRIADFCEQDNPAFKRDAFIKACGVN